MLGKVSMSLDHVNDELEKVGTITNCAVDATEKVDHRCGRYRKRSPSPRRLRPG